MDTRTQPKSAWREFVESIVWAVVVALVIRTFVIAPFKIPSGSMRLTLIEGDRILVNKFSYVRFEPSGITQTKNIRFAKSVIDYIFRWMALKFLPEDQAKEFRVTEVPDTKPKTRSDKATASRLDNGHASVTEEEHMTFVAQADAPACPECGSLMVRNAACYKCMNCGCTSGCS